MSSETSTPYTPASTSTTVAGNETVSLADEIKEYNTAKLIEYLRGQGLNLVKDDFDIIENERVGGQDFLDMTKQDFRDYGMKGGPATRLAKFAKECKDKKLRSFSSYKTKKDLKEVLAKHGVEDGRITDIPQFTPKPHNIDDKNEALVHCLKDIRLRLRNMGPVVESNEAIRCEYISVILHACINIVRELTGKKISLNPQFEVVGEENTGRVDYAIKALEELICITEGKQYQIAIGMLYNAKVLSKLTRENERRMMLSAKNMTISSGSNPLNIRFVETALEEGSEDEKELCKNVKRVMEVIVGLLRERVDVEKEPKNKKARVQEYLKKE
ncbi:hypothetical protein GLOIN_2v1709121 [Rhizophagus clarus]|uniref:SAM domain-containing protein n=1 Tax=Rhizophagus clarus TaxID=94130 RepID=A0A8H3M640_9GLOM|nr:hypothetical protein GLOIN_2v1709121 [Rhizophagus clarus]